MRHFSLDAEKIRKKLPRKLRQFQSEGEEVRKWKKYEIEMLLTNAWSIGFLQKKRAASCEVALGMESNSFIFSYTIISILPDNNKITHWNSYQLPREGVK